MTFTQPSRRNFTISLHSKGEIVNDPERVQSYRKKYLLNKSQFEHVIRALEPYMEIDEYGLHTIRNIYYDTSNQELIRTSLDKPCYKEKFRVRCYGEPTQDAKIFLVCVVMLVVNGNLGTSVAIVGAFGLIRFRTLQGSSRDIAYIFFVMAAGLTCSVGYIGFAIAVTLMVCAILFILQFCHYGDDRTEKKELRITILRLPMRRRKKNLSMRFAVETVILP